MGEGRPDSAEVFGCLWYHSVPFRNVCLFRVPPALRRYLLPQGSNRFPQKPSRGPTRSQEAKNSTYSGPQFTETCLYRDMHAYVHACLLDHVSSHQPPWPQPLQCYNYFVAAGKATVTVTNTLYQDHDDNNNNHHRRHHHRHHQRFSADQNNLIKTTTAP